jgi:hypothetical protein
MLAASENNTVSDADPRVYIPHALSRQAIAGDDVLKSNLMPIATAHEYASASYPDFISARSDLVASFLGKLCEGNSP